MHSKEKPIILKITKKLLKLHRYKIWQTCIEGNNNVLEESNQKWKQLFNENKIISWTQQGSWHDVPIITVNKISLSSGENTQVFRLLHKHFCV